MLLQRFTDRPGFGLAMLVLSILLLAGCAAGPDSKRAGDAQMGPDGMRDIPPQAQTLYEQAIASLASGDTIDAELRFQEFLLQYAAYPGAYVNLAIIFAGRGDDKAVENSLTDALILDPEHAVALNQLGMLLRRQGKFLEAESAYLKAVTARPDYALAHYNLGVLNELYLQRLDAALQHFERYFELIGDDKQVEKWISDLTRRLAASQRTANVVE